MTMAICLGMAWVSHLLGVSYALGAFLAGVIIGGTDFAHQINADIIPFRDVFSGVFLVGDPVDILVADDADQAEREVRQGHGVQPA